MYVLSAGIMAYGLKDKFLNAYGEVQASNLSKSCATEEEADATAKFRAAASQRCFHQSDKLSILAAFDTTEPSDLGEKHACLACNGIGGDENCAPVNGGYSSI